jgi:hypothetical protein
MLFEDSVASSPWPSSVPLGWSVEWDPSLAGNDPSMYVVALLFSLLTLNTAW